MMNAIDAFDLKLTPILRFLKVGKVGKVGNNISYFFVNFYINI